MQIWNKKRNEKSVPIGNYKLRSRGIEVLAMMAMKTATKRIDLENGGRRFLQHGITSQHPESFRSVKICVSFSSLLHELSVPNTHLSQAKLAQAYF
jgi:hypothetical protein